MTEKYQSIPSIKGSIPSELRSVLHAVRNTLNVMTGQTGNNRIATIKDLSAEAAKIDKIIANIDAANTGMVESWFKRTLKNWYLYNGSPVSTFPESGTMGGYAYSASGYAWYVYRDLIPFNGEWVYRITGKIRRTVAATDNTTEKAYLGVTCVASDGVTLINISGSDSYSNQFYVGANQVDMNAYPVGEWRSFTGYFTGGGGAYTSINSANDPSQLPTNVAYIRPTFILNYQDGDGSMELDYLTIDVVNSTPTAWTDVFDDGGKPEDGADATNYNDTRIENLQVVIGSDGALIGGGGGQVEITGLGYVGDLDANNFTNSSQFTDDVGWSLTANWTGLSDDNGELAVVRAGSSGAFKNGFEGDEFGEWLVPTGNTITIDTDAFSGTQSALMTSTEAAPSSSGVTGGVYVRIPETLALQFGGRRIRITVYAKQPTSNASASFSVAYSTSDVGNSGWNSFVPTTSYLPYSFIYDVPVPIGGAFDYLGIWADESGLGLGVLIDQVSIEMITTEGELDALDLVNGPNAAGADVTDYSDVRIENFQITLGNDGSLFGGGGGQVELTGLGYLGDLTATDGADWSVNISGQPSDSLLLNNLQDWTDVLGRPISAISRAAIGTMHSGGFGNIRFVKDTGAGGGANDGEIQILGDTFYHPDGTKRTITGNPAVTNTNYEGASTQDPFFLIYSDEEINARFPDGNLLGSGYFFVATYDLDNDQWQQRDNLNAIVNFTPLATDCIVAIGRKTSTTGGIDVLSSLIGVNTNLPADGADITDYGDVRIENFQITLGTDGTLFGGGGGGVTIGGLGYLGDLDATYGANWALDVIGRPVELTDGRITAGLDSAGDLARDLLTSRLNSSNILRYTNGALFNGDLTATDGATWGSNIFSRPVELTDGRIAAGLDSAGDLARNLTTSRLNSSNILRYTNGALFNGDLTATDGATWGTNVSARPTELTDGRITAGLNSVGDLNRDLTTSRLNTSNVLRYTSGALFSGELTATEGAIWGTNVSSRPVELTDGRIAGTINGSGLLANGVTVQQGNASSTYRNATMGLEAQQGRDGDVITFNDVWDDLPVIKFSAGGLSQANSLANDQFQDIKAVNVSTSGFEISAELKELAGSTVLRTDTGAVSTGTQDWEIHKSQSAQAFDDTYTFQYDVTIRNKWEPEVSSYIPGNVTVGIYTNDGTGWVKRATVSHGGGFAGLNTTKTNQTTAVVVDGLTNHGGREFGITIESEENVGGSLTFDQVTYTTATDPASATATPTGAPDIQYFILGGN